MCEDKKNTLRELLTDESFIDWLMLSPQETNGYWKESMEKDPLLNEFVEKLRILLRDVKVREAGLPSDMQDILWEKISRDIEVPKKKSINLSLLFRYVAVFCALMAIPVCWFLARNVEDGKTEYQALIFDTLSGQVAPDKILIVLGENEKIEIEEKTAEIIHDTEGNISIQSEKQKIDIQSKEQQYNHLYIPYGKTMNLTLSDGTKVWLNSGSKLVYPTVYKKNRREIFIEGEAFLEVAREEKRPFIVKTEQLDINVLGTSFNVSAYKNDPYNSVVLVSGSVCIDENDAGLNRQATLSPSQKFTYEKTTGKTNVQQVNVFEYICWKDGLVYFKNESISNVFRKLERYYNVVLDFNPSVTDHISLSGKLDLKDDIQKTFEILSVTVPIEYKIFENKIKIDVE